MLKGKRIGFIGAGNMGGALVRGLLQAHVVLPEHIYISERSAERTRALVEEWKVQSQSTINLIQSCDVVVLAIKPQDIPQLLAEVGRHFHQEQIIISIAAGLRTDFIQQHTPPQVPVVRVMPNLPVVVSTGASAYCLGSHASWPHGVVASLIFSAVGSVVEVSEDQMDTVTALSGTGPAYVFLLAELLAEAGTREGLPREIAGYLANQTIIGGARMIDQSDHSPAVLRAQVTSRGGTTAAAMACFEDNGLAELFYQGVHAARVRSQELSDSQDSKPSS